MNNLFVEKIELVETNATLPSDIPRPEHGLNLLYTSSLEIEYVLKSLKLNKATSLDARSNHMFKELAQLLSFPLIDLFNFSLTFL